MSVLRSLETKIADLVEGAFGRAFRSEITPVELARRLVREMDRHRRGSLSRPSFQAFKMRLRENLMALFSVGSCRIWYCGNSAGSR